MHKTNAQIGLVHASLPPPASYQQPDFELPALACCTHSHVIPDGGYTLVANASYLPAAAPEPRYMEMLDALSLARGVLVQVSIFGTDNSAMLATLARHPQRLRGVAVVGPDIGDEELLSMHRLGVRGLRFNLMLGGGVGLEAMARLAPRLARMGWHAELLVDGTLLPELAPALESVPCALVLDHMGCLPAEMELDHLAVRALRRFVQGDDRWVNVSGAYRLAKDIDDPRLAARVRALASDAPERIIWGTDWPHVACADMPDAGGLLNLVARWLPDPVLQRKVLADNPGRLYQFG
ncbi:MAG: amidohydrolase family protein [Methylibium sp.]